MKQKSISISLVVILLMVLGNSIGCGGGGGGDGGSTKYTLTITSTAGGNVTAPGEGTFNYTAGASVPLVASADAGYQFVSWTGDVGAIANVTSYNTTIVMNGNYAITANFGLSGFKIIANVPDANQPPTQTLASTIPSNFCAPIAMANVLEYWDDVANHANAQNVTAGLIPETVAEYLGWFMDTNNTGSPDRNHNPGSGTHNLDIMPGTAEYVRWDATHNYPVNPPPPPAPARPAAKLGYDWGIIVICDTNKTLTFNLYKNEIDGGRPAVITFDYWNIVAKGISYTDPLTGETVDVFVWGGYMPSSLPPNPPEYWTYGDIGHAVTGVGYVKNWDPDGLGPIPSDDWVIVHDNWSTTPRNIAIPWANWMCLYLVSV